MTIATLILLALTSSAQAQQPARPPRAAQGQASAPAKGEKAAIERDFIFACSMSRMSMGLLHAPAFQDQKADLASRVAEAVRAGLRTEEAKNTLKAASAGTAETKQKMWSDSAKQLGLDKWKCPSIEAL